VARTIRPVSHSEELRYRAGDISMTATLVLPDGQGRRPWALLLPSWGPRDRDGSWDRSGHPAWFAPEERDAVPGLLARLADALADRGVATLRADPRGCGASGGTWESAPLFTRIDDARDAIGAMRSRGDLDLRRTAVVGHGEGAAIALSVAIGDPAVGVVGMIGAPARSFRTTLRWAAARRAAHGGDLEHPFVEALDRWSEPILEAVERREPMLRIDIGGEPVELELAGWEQAVHTPPLALATMLHRAVVIVHGTADDWVDVGEHELLAGVLREAGNEPATHIVDGADHELAKADDAAIDAIAASIAERMTPRELPPVLLAIEELGGGR
jgi:alpha-beta hydrolase superfamily lysophospholipase